jgi:hypothetical protein
MLLLLMPAVRRATPPHGVCLCHTYLGIEAHPRAAVVARFFAPNAHQRLQQSTPQQHLLLLQLLLLLLLLARLTAAGAAACCEHAQAPFRGCQRSCIIQHQK